jgi:hypothetical protein
MNCPTCKNPIRANSVVFEWCGNKIISDLQPVSPVIIKNNKSLKYILYLALLVLSIILTMNNDDIPFVVAEEIKDNSYLKSQVQSLKLQLATEKRISQKYARDLQEKDNQQSVLTAM